MADVFNAVGDTSPVGVAAPFLTGNFIPAIDTPLLINAMGLVVPWGGGLMARRFADLGEIAAAPAQAEQIAEMAAAMISPSQIINYNFEGLIGPPGIMGPPGPPGIGVTVPGQPGVSGTAITADMPITRGITFADGGGGKVTWSTGTLRYKGVDYTIAAEGTGDTNEYIYWDKDSTPTSFLTTATLATVIGLDKWLMCYNDSGTPQLAHQNKIIHGGYIKASTIDTINLNALSITTAKINNLDVTTGKIAADATSAVYTAYTDGAVGGPGIIQTASSVVVATGEKVIAEGSVADNINTTTDNPITLKFYRDATEIYSSGLYKRARPAVAGFAFNFVAYIDTPSAGTYDYKFDSDRANHAKVFMKVTVVKK